MKKGFTLIELLAVIVILAIIALIATPIILDIIGDTKKESDKRSIEMYGDAIKNAVADYSLKNPTDEEVTFEDIEEEYIEYEGSKVECETHEIYSDGTIYLDKCKVNGNDVEYTYGKEQEEKYKQVYKPQYYWHGTTTQKVSTVFNEEKSQTPPEGQDCYIGLDLNDSNIVLAAYVCFKRNGNEYCLKGYDTAVYNTNVSIIKDAFKDIVDDGSSCSFSGSDYICDNGSLCVDAESNGFGVAVGAYGDVSGCSVSSGGSFGCIY